MRTEFLLSIIRSWVELVNTIGEGTIPSTNAYLVPLPLVSVLTVQI